MTGDHLGEPLARLAQAYAAAREQAARAIVGQEATFELLFAALLAGGHVLLEGVPATAKTLLAQTMAALMAGGPARALQSRAGRDPRLGGARARGRPAPPGRLRAQPVGVDRAPGGPEPGRSPRLPGRSGPDRDRAGRAGVHRRDRPGH